MASGKARPVHETQLLSALLRDYKVCWSTRRSRNSTAFFKEARETREREHREVHREGVCRGAMKESEDR